MILGMVYFRVFGNNYATPAVVGGEKDSYRRFMMHLFIQECNLSDYEPWVEESDLPYLPKGVVAGEPSVQVGFKASHIEGKVATFDYTPLVRLERMFRRQHDQYDEFYHWLVETADSKFR
jgi:hypothetical protein